MSEKKKTSTQPKEQSFLMKFLTRVLAGAAMLSGFTVIVYLGHAYVTGLVLFVSCFMYFEVVALGHKRDHENAVPGFRFMSVLFLLVALFYGYLKALNTQLLSVPYISNNFKFIFDNLNFITYSAYISCFCIFVMLLKKGHYAYQFQQFAWIHMTLFAIVVSLTFIVYNTHQGMIWFVLPVTLINVNDIFAYFSGVAFGRTKLIELSPKKTVEGFIGAAIATAICAFVLTGSLVNYNYMICPKTQYDGLDLTCTPNPIFIARDYQVPQFIMNTLTSINPDYSKYSMVSLAPIQFHAAILSIFASIIAPFGGFFASGLKRGLQIKDFGDLIPGHGGMTDRMDCQTMMGIFSFIYYQTFIAVETVSYSAVVHSIDLLSKVDQVKVLEYLQTILK